MAMPVPLAPCRMICHHEIFARATRLWPRWGPTPDLAAQERPGVIQELAEGRLGLEEQVVTPRQGYETRARNAGRHAAACLEWDAGLIARVQHERRHAHLCEQRGDVGVAVCREDS